MTTLVRTVRLSKSYRQHDTVRALDCVDLDISTGQTLGVVGPSGSGKSTLAKCIVRLEPIDDGEIWFDGQEISAVPARKLRRLRRKFQMLHQDPASALNPRLSVARILEEPLLVQGIGTPAERQVRVRGLLDQVELPSSSLAKRPLELSGGQRQRLALARALALEPKFLVFDEALSNLDLSLQAQLLNLLLDLQASRSLTYLLISHDFGLIASLASEIAVMDHGRIVDRGRTGELLMAPRHKLTKALLDSVPPIPPALQIWREQSCLPRSEIPCAM